MSEGEVGMMKSYGNRGDGKDMRMGEGPVGRSGGLDMGTEAADKVIEGRGTSLRSGGDA